MNLIKKINQELKKARHILIASHQNPEGDAIGSSLALYHHFRKGKKIQVLSLDSLPYFLTFLPGVEKIIHSLKAVKWDFELAIVVDCTDLKRVSEEFPTLVRGKKIINIDHHESNKFFGALNLVKPKVSSTGEIIYELLSHSGQKISQPTATCVYTALMMDTGSFRYPNTTRNTLEVAAKLVALGAQPAKIAKKVYEDHPASWLKLLSQVLPTVNFSPNGKRAELTLTLEMFENSGATKEMSEGLINYLMMVRGVEVAILYRQVEPNKFKVSFRSTGKVNVAKLSETLGGGGHKQAAGATMEGELEQVKALVRERVDNLLRE